MLRHKVKVERTSVAVVAAFAAGAVALTQSGIGRSNDEDRQAPEMPARRAGPTTFWSLATVSRRARLGRRDDWRHTDTRRRTRRTHSLSAQFRPPACHGKT